MTNQNNSENTNQDNQLTFKFDKTFQEKIVQAMLIDKIWAAQFQEVINIDYFQYAHLKLISEKYFDYYKSYKEFPSLELFTKTILREELKRINNEALTLQVKELIIRISRNEDMGDLAFVKEKSLEFCKKAALQKALEKSVGYIQTENYDKVVSVIREAISAGNSDTSGISLSDEEDIDARYSETYRETIPTGIPELDQRSILNGGLGAGEIGFVVAPSGCHAKGTKILMFDGSTKNVEDIQVGDKLMGPDSTERNVLRLVRGREKMYKVIPTKGDTFVVNENHILSLKRTGGRTSSPSKYGEIVNLTVKDYLENRSNTFKKLHKLYKTEALTFSQETSELPVDPYILGVMIGDGYLSKGMIEITTTDNEIRDSIIEHANSIGMGISVHHKKNTICKGYYYTSHGKHYNPLRESLAQLGLLDTKSETKFIPAIYKTSSIENRLQILAGLIDTDGYRHNKCFEFVSKSKQLAEDVIFVARSVGLGAIMDKTKMVNGVPYYRLNISGETKIIPTRLPRKQVNEDRKQVKNARHFGFTLEALPIDDFYGFTVDSDNLYVMDNFFVTHNCGKSQILVHLGAQALLRGKNVVYYTYELNERLVGIRFDSHLVNIDSLDCYDNKDKIKEFYRENGHKLGRLKIKYYPTGSATVVTLKSHLDKLATSGFVPDLVIVDYAGIMRSTDRNDLLRLELKKVCEELRQMAAEMNVPIWTALQSNKEGANAEIIDMTNLAESFSMAHVADFILGLSRKSTQKSTGFGTIFIAKNRAGRDGIQYKVHLDTAKSKLRVLTDDEIQEYHTSVDSEIDDRFNFIFKKLKM